MPTQSRHERDAVEIGANLLVHAQDGCTALGCNQRRSNAAEHTVADFTPGQRADHRFSRQTGQHRHVGGRQPVEFTQQRQVMRQRLAEAKTGVDHQS